MHEQMAKLVTSQAQAHKHASMGIVGGFGLVVHDPGTGQATPSWGQPDACTTTPALLSDMNGADMKW